MVRRRALTPEESTIRTRLSAAVLAAALIAPAAAGAQSYPAPQKPGPVTKRPAGPHRTLTVCHAKKCAFHTIQAAVDKARAGDTVRVRPGVYREAVKVEGAKKAYLRIVGDAAHPERVVLKAKGQMQNGILVNHANEVTVDGFKAIDYRSNGFFFTNLTGYTMNHLVAEHTGVYGLYAFNTVGGRMLNSEAYYVNDGGFYIGQTPEQAKPVRSVVRNVEGWGNPIGFSGTNMRYVTITKSRFYNNAVGIVPNALDSEKWPPEEDNVITDNDIFWNNFNFHQGNPPFAVRQDGTAAMAPVGTGILLLGGHRNLVEHNRIFGNFLAGVGAIEGILLKEHLEAKDLVGNVVRNNVFGLNGTDVNGFDVLYDGSGSDNCFSMEGVTSTYPTDGSTFAGCSGPNAYSASVQFSMMGLIGEGAVQAWNQHAHPAKAGYEPLEIYK